MRVRDARKEDVIASLWSEKARERAMAVGACASRLYTDKRVLERIRELVADPDPSVREISTIAVDLLHVPGVFDAVVANLTHRLPSLRAASCTCLVGLSRDRPEAVAGHLRRRTLDSDPFVAYKACEALASLGLADDQIHSLQMRLAEAPELRLVLGRP